MIRLLAISTLVGLGLFAGALSILSAYSDHHMLYGDANSYYYMFIKAVNHSDDWGFSRAFVDFVLQNDRNPYQNAFVLVLSWFYKPGLLSFASANLLPLLCFTFSLSYAIFERSRSYSSVLFGLMIVATSAFALNPVFGVTAVSADGCAALFYGTALLCLQNSRKGLSAPWMVAFGISASFACLSRYVAVAYLLFAALPVLLYFGYAEWSRSKSVKLFLRPLMFMSLAVALLALPFLIKNLAGVSEFYRKFGYMLGAHTPLTSITYLYGYIKRTMWFDLLCFATVALVSLNTETVRSSRLAVSLWITFAHIIFYVFVVKAANDPQTPIYIFAAFAAGLLTHTRLPGLKQMEKASILRFVVLCAIFTVHLAYSYGAVMSQLNENGDKAEVGFYRAIADGIATTSERKKIRWAGLWSEDFVRPAILSWHFHEKLLVSDQKYMTDHISHWRAFYPDTPLEQIPNAVMEKLNTEVEFAWIRHDPGQTHLRFTNDVSEAVAVFVSEKIRASQSWKLVRTIATGPFGPLDLYVNSEFSEAESK